MGLKYNHKGPYKGKAKSKEEAGDEMIKTIGCSDVSQGIQVASGR